MRPFEGIGEYNNYERLATEDWNALRDIMRASGWPTQTPRISPDDMEFLNRCRVTMGLAPYVPSE